MTISVFLSKILNMSLAGSIAILAVLLLRLVLRKSPKIFSYILWVGVLFRLLCPVTIQLPVQSSIPEGKQPAVSMTETIPEAGTRVEDGTPLPEHPAVPDLMIPYQGLAMEPAPSETVQISPAILFGFWAAGAFGMLLYGMISYFHFCSRLTGALRLRGNVYLVDHLDSAFVAGLLSPKIYLPSNLPEDQRRFILEHERHHIQRFDHAVKFLSYLALCIHWLNPLVWLAFSLSGRDMEMSCDEAVIRKLGEGIRGDYASALIQLATPHVILSGTPLAFGEGDTKGRVHNLSRISPMKKWTAVISCILCALMITACASIPTQNYITLPEEERRFQLAETKDSFDSTDGTVHYQWEVQSQRIDLAWSSALAEPHMLTGEDVRRVTEVLFGEGTYYELDGWVTPNLSKDDIKECIARWKAYDNDEALRELTVRDQVDSGLVRKFIANYIQKLETAPDEVTHPETNWQFRNGGDYWLSERERQLWGTSDFNDEIVLDIPRNDVHYLMIASTSRKEPNIINRISVNLYGGTSPDSLDDYIYYARLCRTAIPTQAQVDRAKQTAQSLLDKMQLGQWAVVQAFPTDSFYRTGKDYVIRILAVPLVGGKPAAYDGQNSVWNGEISYYGDTEAVFEFSADGKLVSFSLQSPVDIKETTTGDQKTMKIEDLMDRAKDELKAQNAKAYGFGAALADLQKTETVECMVVINHIQYGNVRYTSDNGEFRYVPSLVFSGTTEYRGKTSGNLYWRYEESNREDPALRPLLVLNALDGSVIYRMEEWTIVSATEIQYRNR